MLLNIKNYFKATANQFRDPYVKSKYLPHVNTDFKRFLNQLWEYLWESNFLRIIYYLDLINIG